MLIIGFPFFPTMWCLCQLLCHFLQLCQCRQSASRCRTFDKTLRLNFLFSCCLFVQERRSVLLVKYSNVIHPCLCLHRQRWVAEEVMCSVNQWRAAHQKLVNYPCSVTSLFMLYPFPLLSPHWSGLPHPLCSCFRASCLSEKGQHSGLLWVFSAPCISH